MRYRLIAIDLDGTLLSRTGKISDRNLAAIRAAQNAGIKVVPCTGRGWRESVLPLAPLLNGGGDEPPATGGGHAHGVFASGSAVHDLHTGQSLTTAPLPADLALELVDSLFDLPEAVMVFRDAWVTGHDYLITGRGQLTPNSRWWFEVNRVPIAHVERPTAQDLLHTLRVGMLGPGSRITAAARMVRLRFEGRVSVQNWAAVQKPGDHEPMHMLETFAVGVDKWTGIEWIAQRQSIAVEEIAVIGDEINDIGMIERAGCAIAMANAITAVKDRADHVTTDCDQDGVAFAIERILSGQWG